MEQARRPRLTLTIALYIFVLLGAVLFSVVTAIFVADRARVFQDKALEEAVVVRASGAGLGFARALYQDWQSLSAIADRLPPDDFEALATALNVISGDGKRTSWAGFARTDGTVLAASKDLLLKQDVSSRLWFQRGLEGDFAGDVHEAVLLNRLIGSETEPLRFIDLATPIRTSTGQIAGVVGVHINFAWAREYLAETAKSLGLDLFLVSRDGTAIIATDGSEPGKLDLQSMRAAAAGVQTSAHETWPDAKRYFTTVLPAVTYGDLPSFGWRLVARIPPDTFADATADVTRSILLVLAAASAVLLLMTALFDRLFIRPVGALAANAMRIAEGADEYPLEIRRTAELATLSAALARLQGKTG